MRMDGAAEAAAREDVRFAGHTIRDMIAAQRQAATAEAIGLEALEIEAAQRPHPVIASAIEEVRRQGITLGATHAFLLALLPHEEAIAALLRGPAR